MPGLELESMTLEKYNKRDFKSLNLSCFLLYTRVGLQNIIKKNIVFILTNCI